VRVDADEQGPSMPCAWCSAPPARSPDVRS
jgi:hypothetical protein